MATQSQDNAGHFHMAPEKLRRPNSHPFPPNPGKSQNLPATSDLARGLTDSHNSQNGDIVHGELKRSRKSDVCMDGVKQPQNLRYGYESYLAYEESPPGLEDVKESDSFPSRPSRDFFNLSADPHPVWESDTRYDNLFLNQNQTGLRSEGENFTQAQFSWSNSKEFSQVPLHPPDDMTSGATFLPFQYKKWDSKDPGLENGANLELNEKMIEEIEYLFAQNEWDVPNVSPASPEASNLDISSKDKDQKSKDDAFKEGSYSSDLWSKMGGQERTHRFHDQPSGPTAKKEQSSGETQSQQPKVLRVEDLGDCSSLSSEEKVLLESLLSKLNSSKRVNGLRGKGKDCEETQRVTEIPVKEAEKRAIHKTSSTTVDSSTVKPDLGKLGQSQMQESGSGISRSGRVSNQVVQNVNSSNLSEQDFPMLSDDTVDSARKRSKEYESECNVHAMPESLSKRDHSGKTKEEIAFSPTPSKNAKMPVEKTLKKQKVFQSETEMPIQVQKESLEGQNGQESDVEMNNVEEEEAGDKKNIHDLNEKKNIGTAAKRQHKDGEKHEGTVEHTHPQDSSPPQMKKKKRKKKQGKSSKTSGEDEGKNSPEQTTGSYVVGEPTIRPAQQGEVTCESSRQDTKEGCIAGDLGREQMVGSKGSTENKSVEKKTRKSQQEMKHQAKQKKTASAWTVVSGRKGGQSLQAKLKQEGGDCTDVRKNMSDKSCAGASQQSEPQGNGNGKVGSDKREKGKRNGLKSCEHQERPQDVPQSHSDSDGTSFKRKEKESVSSATLNNLKVDKDTIVPQPQASSSKRREHSSSEPSERSQKGTSSNSVPTAKMQGSQATGNMETKPKVVPDEEGHVLRGDVKSTREASKSLPHASASSSSGNENDQKESKPSRSGMNVTKGSCDGDETVNGETKKAKQETERDDKCETKAASDGSHSGMDHNHLSADGGLYKPSDQIKRDSEGKGESEEGRAFDDFRGKRQDKNESEKQQRERSESFKDKKPGRDSTSKSKHSATSKSDHIFLNKHENCARWNKQITFQNLTAAIFAIFTHLKALAAEIWSELPQFGVLMLLCLWAQGLSTIHYFKDLIKAAFIDIFNIVVVTLAVILSKLSKFRFLWAYFLKPILVIAAILLVLACEIIFRLIGITFRLLRAIYRLKYPPSTNGFPHHEADPNTDNTSRPRQEFHDDSFSHSDHRQGQSHTSDGSSEHNAGNNANFSSSHEESGGASFNNFNSSRRHEGMNGTFGASSPFGSRYNYNASSNKSQSSQSSDSRPDNKGAVYAIQRILLAVEEDPYDVLGLGKDCLQEDIKKAYRRLAVIVHPDKCDHPDAQRAFQKLQVAHDKIGSEENRAKFEQEKRHNEFARSFMDECQKRCDLINNSVFCQCGSFHPKIATDRNPGTARYCWDHGAFHSAHQNDVWAETSCMGLKIHCFYCDGGIIYDVTQWAQCQKILGKMQTNGCKVTVRMEGNPEPQSKPPPDFEDFFRNFESGTHRGRAGSGSYRSRQKEKNSTERNNKKKKRNGRR